IRAKVETSELHLDIRLIIHRVKEDKARAEEARDMAAAIEDEATESVAKGEEQVCGGDFKVLADQCYQFVRVGGSPVLQSHPVGDIPCVCKHTTKPMDRFIGMKKVVLVSKCCGSPLERGTKCGSK
ncbi:unnamed protein product, partial [Musa hybrid cultivar]